MKENFIRAFSVPFWRVGSEAASTSFFENTRGSIGIFFDVAVHAAFDPTIFPGDGRFCAVSASGAVGASGWRV